jgi:hypothetical protein
MSTNAKPRSKHVIPYKTKDGRDQFRPSVELAMVLQGNDEGFCLACGESNDGVEPDARRYECQCCGLPKVYGIEELTLMGLVR